MNSQAVVADGIKLASAAPNLKFYAPPGWSNTIVVRNAPDGGITDDDPFVAAGLQSCKTIYVNWAVINAGTTTIRASSNVAFAIGVNEQLAWEGYLTSDLEANQYFEVHDVPISLCNEGEWSMVVVVDAYDAVEESDESDNWVSRPIDIVTPARFVPVNPCRVVDTRFPAAYPVSGGGQLTAYESRSFPVPASGCGIPPDALAYSLNGTVIPRGQSGLVNVWLWGRRPFTVPALSSPDGRTKANAVIVPSSYEGGAVAVLVSAASDLILDINGYFVAPGRGNDLSYFPLPPCRLSDTRLSPGINGGPALAAGETRSLSTWNRCGIPETATALSLNYTVAPHGPLGYLTTWPAGQAQPLVSTLNAPTGTAVANAAIVPVGLGGQINVFAASATDVIVDVNGYFQPQETPAGLSYFVFAPCRISDTRSPPQPFGGPPLDGGSTRTYALPASSCFVPSAAQAYLLNAAVVPSGGGALEWLTLWPAGVPQPSISTLNALDGAFTSNAAIVGAGTNGSINAYVPNATDLILDIHGYFGPWVPDVRSGR